MTKILKKILDFFINKITNILYFFKKSRSSIDTKDITDLENFKYIIIINKIYKIPFNDIELIEYFKNISNIKYYEILYIKSLKKSLKKNIIVYELNIKYFISTKKQIKEFFNITLLLVEFLKKFLDSEKNKLNFFIKIIIHTSYHTTLISEETFLSTKTFPINNNILNDPNILHGIIEETIYNYNFKDCIVKNYFIEIYSPNNNLSIFINYIKNFQLK